MNWKHWKSPSLSKVIALELEITGHKASHDDEYEEKREELKRLREELAIPNHAQQKHGHSNFN